MANENQVGDMILSVTRNVINSSVSIHTSQFNLIDIKII